MKGKEQIQEWLIKISREDDQRAFRYLFDFYHPKLLNYSLYFLESKSAADEVISTVFLGIWSNRTRIERIERFDSYIFRAVKNKCLNYLRDVHRIKFESLDDNELKMKKSVYSPEGSLINGELRTTILQALDTLPPRCRMVFELVKQDGFKYKEAAKLLGVSVNTVENQMGKAMAILREKLRNEFPAAKVRKINSK